MDNYPAEIQDRKVVEGQTVKEAEEAFDGFVENISRQVDYVKKHALPIGLNSIISF